MVVKLSAMSLLLASCANSVKFSDSVEPVDGNKAKTEMVMHQTGSYSIEGKASYYHDKFDGRMTANGEKFDQKALTAAHKTLPFGTVLQVTNIDNGKTVKVRINDRGPYVGGRVIDLSKAAAQQLGMMDNGLANVRIQIL